jgi:hypothetical protein
MVADDKETIDPSGTSGWVEVITSDVLVPFVMSAMISA